MTARSPSAFMLSAMLHALFAVALLYMAYALKDDMIDQGKVFELVAGEGDNFAATEAPALGTPTGTVKFQLPPGEPAPVIAPPAPEPVVAPAPEPVAPAPVEAVPPPKVVPKATPKPEPSPVVKPDVKSTAKAEPPPVPNITKNMKRVQVRIDSKQRAQRAKEEKEAARQAALAAKQAEIAARKSALTGQGKGGGGAQGKIEKIDAEGIVQGVLGGSTSNKTGGAGGTALSRAEQDLLGTYFQLLKERLKEAHEKPINGGDSLVATAEFHVSPAGTLSQVRIVKSSGDAEFDQSVLDAFHKVSSIRRQDDQGELVRTIIFRMKDPD